MWSGKWFGEVFQYIFLGSYSHSQNKKAFFDFDYHLLLQDIDLSFFDLQHVLHVPDFSGKSALLLRQVLQLLGFLVQEGLFLLQTQTKSINLM